MRVRELTWKELTRLTAPSLRAESVWVQPTLAYGAIVEQAVVRHVDSAHGLLMALPEGARGYVNVHIITPWRPCRGHRTDLTRTGGPERVHRPRRGDQIHRASDTAMTRFDAKFSVGRYVMAVAACGLGRGGQRIHVSVRAHHMFPSVPRPSPLPLPVRTAGVWLGLTTWMA